jgi:hypothetical protein
MKVEFESFSNKARHSLGFPELDIDTLNKCICLGNTQASCHEQCVELMEGWVSHIDRELEKIWEYGEGYVELMDKRLFTFSEYQQLFDKGIAERYFRQFPIFEFLMIRSDEQRNLFMLGKEATFKSYMECLSEYRHVEMVDFFFKELSMPLPLQDMQRHTFISGRSGSGKSELLKSIFYQMQLLSQENQQFGMVLLDPHGDLAEEVRAFNLNTKRKRVVYIDPHFGYGKTPVLNPFELKDRNPQDIDLFSQELSRIFQELIPNTTLSNQMEAILVPCISVLLLREGSSLADLQRFMDDSRNEDLIALGKESPNESHRQLFEHHFLKSDYRTTKTSIYTKIQSLLNSQTFSHLVNGKNTVDLEQAIDAGKVLIFNLSQGKMGKDCSMAYGRFLVAMLQGIALRRANVEKKNRKPLFLFIDEFQNYISPSIEKILSEARKYKLHLILANQNLAQITDKKLAEAILGNTNVKLVGNNSAGTLKPLAQELGLQAEELLEMQEYHFCLKAGSRLPVDIKPASFLMDFPEDFSLSPQEKRGLENYLLNQSGYYRAIPKSEIPAKENRGQETDKKESHVKAEASKAKYKMKK